MAKTKNLTPAIEPQLYDDDEMARASSVPVPSLRLLQAAGAVGSTKVSKEHGGFRRMWAFHEVMKAAVAGAMSEHFAWNIRLTASVMSRTPALMWTVFQHASEANESDSGAPKGNFVGAKPDDWFVELVDRKFLFLRVPEPMKAFLSKGSKYNDGELFLGLVGKEDFTMIPWGLEVPATVAAMREGVNPKSLQTAIRFHHVSLIARQNFLSKASVNLSIQARAAAEKLKGRKVRFIQDLVQPKKGGSGK